MTSFAAYLALAIYPFVLLILPDPVSLYWGYRGGKWPMPPEMKERAERIGRYMTAIRYGLIGATVLYLMNKHSVPFHQVGLHLDDWARNLSLGVVVSLVIVAFGAAFRAFLSERHSSKHFVLRGSTGLWLTLFLLGAFAEELWRAFCLATLMATGHSPTMAVLVSSIFFGLGHFGNPFETGLATLLGQCLGAASAGTVFAALFLWTNSLVATYVAHFLSNLISMYVMRKKAAQRTTIR